MKYWTFLFLRVAETAAIDDMTPDQEADVEEKTLDQEADLAFVLALPNRMILRDLRTQIVRDEGIREEPDPYGVGT